MINIGADNAGDAFYRYKMPKLVAKIEGRGNGIKTNVVNNVDIAKALARPPEYILKFFGCELGAQTNFDSKTGTSIVNGAHDLRVLNEKLEGFIKKYVQCYSCGNPETVIKIKKDNISLKCKACGAVSDVDPRHKVNTFILNHPPEEKLSKEEKKLKKAEKERLEEAGGVLVGTGDEEGKKKEKKEKKEKSKDKEGKKEKKEKKKKGEDEAGPSGGDKGDEEGGSGGEDGNEEEEEDSDDVVWMTDTSAEAAKKRAEEQLTAATSAMVTVGNIEAEAEAARKKAEKEAKKAAEAEAARKKAEAAAAEEERLAKEAAKKLALAAAAAAEDSGDDDDDEEQDEAVAEVHKLIANGSSTADVVAAVKKLEVKGGAPGRMRVLYDAVFGPVGPNDKLATAAKARRGYLLAHAKEATGQLAQLIAAEHMFACGLAADRHKEVPLLLKALYDMDVLDGDVLLAWFNKPDAGAMLAVPRDAAKAVRKAAEPLVEWLQEDEDDDDDDEEDDE